MKTLVMTFLVVYSLNTPKEFKGTVLDFNNFEKLAGVMVVANKVDTTYTDLNGDFTLKNTNGIKTLDFNLTSYEKNNFILVQENTDTLVVKPINNFLAKKN